MRILIVKIYKPKGHMTIKTFHVAEKDYQADNMQIIYFKYIKPWFNTFPETILKWEWDWSLVKYPDRFVKY